MNSRQSNQPAREIGSYEHNLAAHSLAKGKFSGQMKIAAGYDDNE